MADSDSGYKVGPGRPPLHTRFKFGGCSALSPWSGRRGPPPARTSPAGRGGQGGSAAVRGPVAAADPARDRRSEGGGPARIARR